MNGGLTEQLVCCPHCGETIEVLLDLSVDEQRYIEDCQVCCRPIEFFCSSTDTELVSIRTQRSD